MNDTSFLIIFKCSVIVLIDINSDAEPLALESHITELTELKEQVWVKSGANLIFDHMLLLATI